MKTKFKDKNGINNKKIKQINKKKLVKSTGLIYAA
jgi:hypothetical protein